MSPWRTDCIFASLRGGWRTVSEDSQVRGRLSTVHLLDDARDLRNPLLAEMTTRPHQGEHLAELRQILGLRGPKRHLFEERHDPLLEVVAPADAPAKDVFAVVVPPGVAIDRPAVEELLQELERSEAPLALRDDELRSNLPTEPQRRTPVDVDAKASFAVDESGDPTFQPEPFLLIICTRHVVTILPAEADGMSSAGYSDVPAYGQLHPPHRCRGGQRLSSVTLGRL